MMPLAAIDALEQTVTPDWSSPVADAVAAAWGAEPGAARWWRSSASHIFVVPILDRRCYLRFVPESVRSLDEVRRIAVLMSFLSGSPAAGAAPRVRVVAPVPSLRGEWAELVETSLGPMCAMVVEAAPGTPLDASDLSGSDASAWGRALAELHVAAASHPWPSAAPVELESSELSDALRALPADPSHAGLIHGDFELDNIAWDNGIPTVYDFDEATISWYAADVAYALRDVASRPDLVAAFLDGYRTVRPLDEDSVPLFRRVNALRSALRIEALLALPCPAGVQDLADRLARVAAEQRAIAATAPD